MADRWYYLQNKQKLGPLTQDEMCKLVSSGLLHPADMIWQEGTPKWVPAGSLTMPLPAQNCHSPAQSSLPEGKGTRSGGHLSYLGRSLSNEFKETAKATWCASAQLAKNVNGALRQLRLTRALTYTQVELGQRLCEIGVGDEQIRSQVGALDERLRIIKEARGSTRTVKTQRKQLLLQLATAALAQKQPPAGAEKQYEAAACAGLRLQQHVELRATVASQRQSWCRALIGFATIACLVVVSLAVARNFVANDSSSPQGEVDLGVPISQAPPTKADDELPKKAESPEKKSPENSPPVSNSPEVTSEGLGATPDAALKDAFRNAVRQVVGAVVDAETLVKNDEVVSDKVLTYSDGFIKTYDEISKEQKKDLFWIKIKALVERRSVIAKLKEAKVAVKDIDGKGIFAEIVTQQEAIKNARDVFERACGSFTGGWIKAEVAGKPEIIDKNDTTVRIRVTFHFEPAMEEFAVFAKRLSNVLDRIAIKSGEFQFVAGDKDPDPSPRDPNNAGGFQDGNRIYIVPSQRIGGGSGSLARGVWSWRAKMSMAYDGGRPDGGRPDGGRPDGGRWETLKHRRQIVIAINTQVSQDRDRSDWRYFVIDDSARPVLDRVCSISNNVRLVFEDREGRSIVTDTLENDIRSYQVVGGPLMFLLTPLFLNSHLESYQGKRTFSRDITLSLAEIKNVHRIRCVLTQRTK